MDRNVIVTRTRSLMGDTVVPFTPKWSYQITRWVETLVEATEGTPGSYPITVPGIHRITVPCTFYVASTHLLRNGKFYGATARAIRSTSEAGRELKLAKRVENARRRKLTPARVV